MLKNLIRVTLPALALVVLGIVILFANLGKASCSTEKTKKLVSVCIEDGDTVWTLAERFYSEECGSMKAYVKEISTTNHLTSSESIHSGNYLVIPYYE